MPSVKIMGILNVTPDSFSDGGRHNSPELALAGAKRLIDEGADILDVGGESTRPFASPVSISDELARTIPAIELIKRHYPEVPLSIDTRNAEVAEAALAAGADMINDISALRHDPAMIKLAQETEVPVIIMHMQNNPANMQLAPRYNDVVQELYDFFQERLRRLEELGLDLERIIIDPGIGFGKTLAHNLSILKHLGRFRELGRPILLGHSRKSFLGEITGKRDQERDFATAVVAALAVNQGVSMIRVHRAAMVKEAVMIARAIDSAAD
ncbi:MAG: dihydropteroate synthase [Deltaproteobacteria bacterium]|nr:MAG: dihydropteroate synthase [Deltaproteobacteria bacterium]